MRFSRMNSMNFLFMLNITNNIKDKCFIIPNVHVTGAYIEIINVRDLQLHLLLIQEGVSVDQYHICTRVNALAETGC